STSALQEIAGGYALLVDPMDVAAIARGIVEIATHPERRSELIELGRRRSADFSWDRAAEQTLRVYAEALARPSRPAKRLPTPDARLQERPRPSPPACTPGAGGNRSGRPCRPAPPTRRSSRSPTSRARSPRRSSATRSARPGSTGFRSRGADTGTTCRSSP